MNQDHGQALGIDLPAFQGRLDPGYIPVVIRPPDIDDPVEAPVEFLKVIGDIRGEVGLGPVGADHDPVFFVSEGAAFEPQGPLFLVK